MADASPEGGGVVAVSLPPHAGDQQEADPAPDETSKGAEYSVRVAIRVRPPLPQELQDGPRECLCVQPQSKQIVVGKDTWTFDQVFGPEAPQERIHEEAAWPLIEGLGQGLNATLLAYGQTSAGKTYTLGSCHNAAIPEEQHGIIPRFVNSLFHDLVYPRHKDADTTIRVSFVELHNEDINDLLDLGLVDKARGVLIREDPNHGVVILGMKEVEVRKPTELLRCLEKGAVLRTTASTQLNEQSSRSHAIFTVSLEQTLHSNGDTLSAKVRFADLAGSERAKKSGTVGERFREGVSINQGLLALGNVISALGDPKLNRSYVPYRDSKLTRMLQDSLGGNSRTLMIACVSPAAAHLAETLNTLKYANRAKNIKNKVVVNVSVKDIEVAKLKEKIQELQSDLINARQQQSICASLDPTDSVVRETAKHLSELRCSHERLEQDNRRLRLELAATEQSLHQTAKDALDFRVKYEQCAMQMPAAPEAPVDVPLPAEAAATADSGSTADNSGGHQSDVVQTTLERYVQTIQELQHRNRKLERFLADRESSRDRDLLDPTRSLEQPVGTSGSAARDSKDDDDEEDAREERRHLSSQRELGTEVQELDIIIQDKETLMEQLTKQSRVFNSMRENYELRLQQLQEAVEHATEEKEQTLKEMHQMQHEEGAAKRKALLEGRLRELSRQLVELRRRQAEAQRLLRVKEQQEAQIARMYDEIGRLRGQKEVVESRMRYEEQQFRLWKKRWLARVREATRQSAQLQRQNNSQGRKLVQKTMEADQSARKVEELRREQKQYLDLARQRVQVEREAARAAKVREANARLRRELEARQRKVEQMETMLSERMRLEGLGSERLSELKEVEEQIESLDAQIDFDSECIMQSQTQILKLTVPEPAAPETARAERVEGASDESACPDPASGSTVVAQLRTLEEARSTCLACFQSIDELQAERSQLQGRVSELEVDLANREAHIVELQARERLAETQWVEQANALQRLHLDKEVYLLGRVDRNLTEKHDLTEPEESASCEPPAASASPAANTTAMLELLECRRQQIEALGEETEMLHRQVEHAALACNVAEEAANEAQEKLSRAETRARSAEQRAEEAMQRLSQAQAASSPSLPPASLPNPGAPTPITFAPVPRFGRDSPSQENLDSGMGVEAWRSILVGEEGTTAALEDIAHRTGEQLGNIWRDLGISADAQRMHLQGLTENVLHLCLQELRIHEQDRARLQSEHDAFQGVVACHNIQVADAAQADEVSVSDALHRRHTALRCAAQQKLDEDLERLRVDLKDLFGLPQSVVDATVAAAQLKMLTKCSAQCFPGRNAHAPTSLDLELLGLGIKGRESCSLQHPTIEAFATISERQSQVATLLNETSAELRRADMELKRYFESFGDGDERRAAFVENRGFGLPALYATRRELQQQQHGVRLRIADAQLRMTEQWSELGVSPADQERVLQGLRVSAQQGALEELQALTEETSRLESKIEGRRDILRRVKACTDLEGQIQDFEREASDSTRLRGSSKQLLEEEQQRLRFRKKKARLMEVLLTRITDWEAEHGERFLHKGAAIREALQQDLEDTKELGGLTLAQPAQASTPMGLAARSEDSAASLGSVGAWSVGSGPPSSAVPMAAAFGLRSLRTARFEAVSTRAAVAAAALGASPVAAPAGSTDAKRRLPSSLAPPRPAGGGSGNSPRRLADSGSISPRPAGGVVRSQESLGFGN